MADTFGIEQLPLAAPTIGYPAGDRALGVLLGFFKAVANAKAAAAWNAQGVAPNVPVVKQARAYDPKRSFNTNDLPALFMWRSASTNPQHWYADDVLLDHSTVELLWVMPQIGQDIARARDPFIAGLAKVLNQRLEWQRDPSFVVVGDPDPRATTLGSSIATFAGYWSLLLKKWSATQFTPTMVDGHSTAQIFDAFSMTFELTEQFVDDVTKYDPLGGMLITLQSGDTIALVTETQLSR